MAQTVKNLPAMQETWAWSLDQEDLLEKGMATHASILAWRIPRTAEPGGLQVTVHGVAKSQTQLSNWHLLEVSWVSVSPVHSAKDPILEWEGRGRQGRNPKPDLVCVCVQPGSCACAYLRACRSTCMRVHACACLCLCCAWCMSENVYGVLASV